MAVIESKLPPIKITTLMLIAARRSDLSWPTKFIFHGDVPNTGGEREMLSLYFVSHAALRKWSEFFGLILKGRDMCTLPDGTRAISPWIRGWNGYDVNLTAYESAEPSIDEETRVLIDAIAAEENELAADERSLPERIVDELMPGTMPARLAADAAAVL